jgi:catechol 2,3-dioxygenase-like lactoylglutathione lyase family enzyme
MNTPGPRLALGTVTVPNMQEALALYVGLLEQKVILDTALSDAEAHAWHAPAIAGARSVVLQPPSDAAVYLRLIEQTQPAGYRPGTHTGWAALELTVESADRLHQRLIAAKVPIIGAPKALAFTDKLYPMQALGPGGEALYLNEIRGNLPNSDLPMSRCWVDELFITIVGARDREATLDFYNELLGTGTGGTWDIEYGVINRGFGLPETTKHMLSTCSDKRVVLFEVDQYPAMATPKPVTTGALPPGVAMVGVAVAERPQDAVWLSEPAARTEAPYFGKTVGVVRGPDAEIVELIW